MILGVLGTNEGDKLRISVPTDCMHALKKQLSGKRVIFIFGKLLHACMRVDNLYVNGAIMIFGMIIEIVNMNLVFNY